MAELITHRLTAHALWMPEGWSKRGIAQEEIEKAVLHAIVEEKDEISVMNDMGNKQFFALYNRPLEYKSQPHEGLVEIEEFTLEQMTRRYVSLTPVAW